MRKTSAMLLAVVLVIALAVVSVSAETVTYDAMADWDTENADGSSVPWKYVYSTDGGSSFGLMGAFVVREWGEYWYIAADAYDGFGTNNDMPGMFEANVNNDNAGIAAISFVAPEDGDYTVKPFSVTISWGQEGDTFYIMNGSTEVYSAALGFGDEGEEFVLNVPETTVALSAGDELTFYGTTTGEWLSLYIDGLAVEGSTAEETTADETTADETTADETTAEATTTEESPETGDSGTSAPIYFLISGIVVLAAVLVLNKKSQRDQA